MVSTVVGEVVAQVAVVSIRLSKVQAPRRDVLYIVSGHITAVDVEIAQLLTECSSQWLSPLQLLMNGISANHLSHISLNDEWMLSLASLALFHGCVRVCVRKEMTLSLMPALLSQQSETPLILVQRSYAGQP